MHYFILLYDVKFCVTVVCQKSLIFNTILKLKWWDLLHAQCPHQSGTAN